MQRDLDGIPIRTFYFDGTQSDLERDVGIFLELAHTYQQRKKRVRRYPAVLRVAGARLKDPARAGDAAGDETQRRPSSPWKSAAPAGIVAEAEEAIGAYAGGGAHGPTQTVENPIERKKNTVVHDASLRE